MKFNLKAIIAGLVFMLIGILLVLTEVFWLPTDKSIWLNVGCSLIASSLVVLLTTLLVDGEKYDPLQKWGISKIYRTRAEKNADSDPYLAKSKYKVDAVAFGLSSFRSKYSDKVEKCLKRGVDFRFLVMNPDGDFIHPRESEEGEVNGNIQKSINDLIEWADNLNKKKYKGSITIKAYNCMTLDFYWRVDDTIYIGPYWYGFKSADTITYRFDRGGEGFDLYSSYFEKLWDDAILSKEVTKRKPRK